MDNGKTGTDSLPQSAPVIVNSLVTFQINLFGTGKGELSTFAFINILDRSAGLQKSSSMLLNLGRR